MKKKIIAIVMIVLLMVTMVTVASAESHTIPKIETEQKYILIQYLDGKYTAYTFDGYEKLSWSYALTEGKSYTLNGDTWEYKEDVGTVHKDKNYIYDTSGVFVVNGSVKFEKPRVKLKDFTDVLKKLQEQLTVENCVKLLVVASTAVVGLVFLAWGVSKAESVYSRALKKGKIKL